MTTVKLDVAPWDSSNTLASGSNDTPVEIVAPVTKAPWDSGNIAEDTRIPSSYADRVPTIADLAKLSFAGNRQERIEYLARKIFPELDMPDAIKRFSIDGGDIYYRDFDNKQKKVADSVLKNVALGIGPSIPAVTGTAAGIATAPMALAGPGGLAASIGLTTAAGAGGEALRQKIGDHFLDSRDPSIDYGQVALEGGYAGLGQGIGTGIATAINRSGVAPDIARFNPADAAQAIRDANKLGIKLTPAEATGMPSLAAQQKRLGNITPTSDRMEKFYDARDDAVFGAWENFLASISRHGDVDEVADTARKAANKAIETLGNKRFAAAKPHYDAAFASNQSIDSPMIDQILETPAGQKALEWARNRVANRLQLMGEPDPELTEIGRELAELGKGSSIRDIRNWNFFPTEVPEEGIARGLKLKTLDLIKQGLDDEIGTVKKQVAQGNARQGEFSDLINLKNKLVAELDELDATEIYKGKKAYARARSIWSGQSGSIEQAMDSTVRILANLKDTNLQKAALTIFNPGMRTPGSVVRAKRLLSREDPKAWQGLKRIFLQTEMDKAFRIAESGEVINPAGKIFKLLHARPMKKILKAALEPEEFARYANLMATLKRASSVKRIGSDTAWNQDAIRREAQNIGTFNKVFGAIVRNLNPAQLLRSVDDFMTNRAIDRNATRMTEIITSGDETSLSALRELNKTKVQSPKFWALLGAVLSRGTGYSAEAALD